MTAPSPIGMAFWTTAGITAGSLLALLAVTFLIGTLTGKHSVMDVAWGAGIMVAGAVSYLASAGHGVPARRYRLVAAAAAWGYRLASHVAVRARDADEDPRYRDLLARAPGNRNLYALRAVYLPQGVILWVACLPLPAGMVQRAPVSAITIAGCRRLGHRVLLRGRRRLAAGEVPRRPGQPRPDHGPGTVAVHQAPELLRRRVHVVGDFRHQLRVRRAARDRRLAAADDLHLDPGNRGG
jgi:hypothetical protein